MKRICEKSPCVGCNRVKDPKNCENKNCKPWRAWFLGRWDKINGFSRRYGKPAPQGKPDPCSNCLFQRDNCLAPCKSKRAWLDEKRGITQ